MPEQKQSSLCIPIVTGVALVLLAKFAKPVLVPIALAFTLSLVLAQPVHYLMERWRMPVQGAAALVLGTVFGLLILTGIVLLPLAKDWIAATMTNIHDLGDLLDRLRATLPWLAPASPREKLVNQDFNITGVVLDHARLALLTSVATVILTFLLLISERWIFARILALLPDKKQRARLLGTLRESQREVNHFFSTMGVINLGMGVTIAIVMAAMGVPNALFSGVLVTLLLFIPYFGPMLLIVLFLFAGISLFDAPAMMFAPALAFIAIDVVQSNVISPWIMGRRLRLNPLAIFFSVLLLGWLWGVVGAFLTIPLLVVVRCIARRSKNKMLFHFVGRSDDVPSTFGEWLTPRTKARKYRRAKA